jgi:tetratricopeptide (TPR) repeat protein
MKKLLIFLAVLTLTVAFALSANATDVVVDGVKVEFNSSMGYPFIENGRTLVPLRASMEALGAEVVWDGEQRCAIVKKGPATVVCYIDEACIYRNGTKIPNDAAAQIKDSRTYLPIRAVAEALDATVGWDGNVVITTGAAGNLIYSIENSGQHVSNIWKCWESALAAKNSANYQSAIEQIKQLAPDFLAKHDGNSNAMLYKHLGECYSALGMNAEAAECFKREAELWASVSKTQENIDANRRATLINSSVQM